MMDNSRKSDSPRASGIFSWFGGNNNNANNSSGGSESFSSSNSSLNRGSLSNRSTSIGSTSGAGGAAGEDTLGPLRAPVRKSRGRGSNNNSYNNNDIRNSNLYSPSSPTSDTIPEQQPSRGWGGWFLGNNNQNQKANVMQREWSTNNKRNLAGFAPSTRVLDLDK